MKNTKTEKNLPGTYKLVVTWWDGGGDMPLPMDGEYIEGSFEVDVEGSALNEVD